MFEQMGKGYGIAVSGFFKQQQKEKLLKKFGNQPLVARYAQYEGGVSKRFIDVEEILDEIKNDRYGDLFVIHSWDDLVRQYHEICESDYGFLASLLPPDDDKKHQREEKRKELEQAASDFASKHQVKTASLEFIDAIYEEIAQNREDRDHWNNPEVRAEEWAACRYAGSNSYYDDLNFVNHRYNSSIEYLHDILDWLGEACPLLMAQYNERKLLTR